MAKKNTKPTDSPDGSEKIEVKGAPKVNDVAKPGETPPSQTSRPIITNHSGMIKQDPMMAGKSDSDKNEDKAEQTEDIDPEKLVKKNELNVKPVDSEDEIRQDAEEDKEDKAAAKPTEAEEKEAENPQAGDEKSTEDKPAEADPDDTSDSAAIDSIATNAEKNAAAKKSEEEKSAEKVQELIASKKYYVPIVEGGHKASSQRLFTWLLLFLLLVSVGVYLAIDAGYIDVGISLPLDLIKN